MLRVGFEPTIIYDAMRINIQISCNIFRIYDIGAGPSGRTF